MGLSKKMHCYKDENRRYMGFPNWNFLAGCPLKATHVCEWNSICVKQRVDGQCVSSGRLPSPLRCCSWAGPLSWTLCGDWRFQAGPRSLPPVTHFQRCTTSMTFIALQGRVVHLQEKTNKYGGRRSASVQTLLFWLSVSMAPQHLWSCRRVLRHDFDMCQCVYDTICTHEGQCAQSYVWEAYAIIALAHVSLGSVFCVKQFWLVLGNNENRN